MVPGGLDGYTPGLALPWSTLFTWSQTTGGGTEPCGTDKAMDRSATVNHDHL